MTTFIIKSSLSLIVLFGLYWFLLRQEKLFVFNRVFLIFSVIFSLALPFISIPITIQESEPQGSMLTTITSAIPTYSSEQNTFGSSAQPINETYSLTAPVSEGINYSQILILLYIMGVLFLLVRFIRNIFFLSRQMRISEKIIYSGQRLVLTNHQVNPFCFFNTIFISKQDYLNDKIAEELLSHEIEHIRQSHTVDVIFIELVKIIYWFNPILILYSTAIRVNHEYLADNAVTKGSSDIKSYAEKLINYIGSKRNIPLTSGFNPSLTRKRLLMLTKSKSRMINYGARIFATIGLATSLFLILSFSPTYSNSTTIDQNKNLSTVKESGKEITFAHNQNKIVSAVTENSKPEKSTYIKQTKNIPTKNVKGFVVNKFGKYIEGLPIILSGKKTGITTDKMGYFVISSVPEDAMLTFSYEGYITQTIKPVFNSEMVVRFIIENESSLPKEKIISTYLPNFETNPLIIIDSVTVEKESMYSIDPTNMVSSLNVLKGKEATDKYGEKGKNGIIEIFTDGNTFGKAEKTRSETPKIEKLLIVDGVVSTKKLEDIPVENIDMLSVLGKTQAVKKYGEKGKNGAIEIITKGKTSVPTEIKTYDIDKKMTFSSSGYIKNDTINQMIVLVDNAILTLGEITIKADSIVFNTRTYQIYATGRQDGSGTIIGKAFFKEGSQEMEADEITYNMNTRKASAKNVKAQVNMKLKDSGSLVNFPTHNQIDKSNNDGSNKIKRDTIGRIFYYPNPLYTVGGIQHSHETNDTKTLLNLYSPTIKRSQLFKGGEQVGMYGNRVGSGVIVVTKRSGPLKTDSISDHVNIR
jgi:beta-lactamase regulating signal transducer with metallopeptidase domain/lipopolysaccharide export system protein LptA